jgi:hypothetical protein
MKQLLKLLLGAMLILSCAPQVQLVTLQTAHQNLKSDDLVYQDSLIKITYDFYSPNGTVGFTLVNISKKPIFIDWKNSLYITSSEKRISYWNDEAKLNGSIQSTSVDWTSWLSTSSASVNASIKQEQRISFLPPATEIKINKFRISNGTSLMLNEASDTIYDHNSWNKTKKQVAIKVHKYNLENSPLKFRNYLTLSLTEDFKQPIYYDFEFWASEIREMDVRQLVGNSLYRTYMFSYFNGSKYHPYKQADRFFIIPRNKIK